MAGARATEVTDYQSTEIEVSSLKKNYGSKCKVIHNIGDFIYVIDVRLKEMDLALKFQLEGKFYRIHIISRAMVHVIGMEMEIFFGHNGLEKDCMI